MTGFTLVSGKVGSVQTQSRGIVASARLLSPVGHSLWAIIPVAQNEGHIHSASPHCPDPAHISL